MTFPQMYEEWASIRDRPSAGRTDEEMAPAVARYQELQAAIIAAEPLEPRDVAIMFLVDTDDTESDFSSTFEERMRELARTPPVDPLLDLIDRYSSGVAAWRAIPPEAITSANEDELTRTTYGEFQDALSEAAPAATSLVGVRAALQLAVDEDGFSDTITKGAVRAALAYFDGRALT